MSARLNVPQAAMDGINGKQIDASPTLPRRRGKADKTLVLEEAILRIVKARHPVTVRGVCYALFADGLIESMAVKETNRISRVMTKMRETDVLDWRLIVDGSRRVDRPGRWSDPDEIIRSAVANYRRNNWQEQPYYVEVWSEKSTVQGLLQPILNEYGVAFRPMKGFGSHTIVREAAEDSIDAPAGKPCVALYMGDWDPSGLHMSKVDVPARIERYGGAWTLVRIALLVGDLVGLPHFNVATKVKDPRYKWFRQNTTADPSKAWELDAMDPNDLRQRVEYEITSLIDHDAWERAIEVEAAEVESMREFHRSWKASKRVGGAHA